MGFYEILLFISFLLDFFLPNSWTYVITVQVFKEDNKNWQNLQLFLTLISNITIKKKEKNRQIIKRQFSFFSRWRIAGFENSRKILSNHKKTRQNGGGTTLFTPLEQPWKPRFKSFWFSTSKWGPCGLYTGLWRSINSSPQSCSISMQVRLLLNIYIPTFVSILRQ